MHPKNKKLGLKTIKQDYKRLREGSFQTESRLSLCAQGVDSALKAGVAIIKEL
jgi:hypothetical protein